MTRQNKTPRQRAEEQLAAAERMVARLTDKRANLRADLAQVEAEHDAAVARRDHLSKHPDLQQQPTTPTTEEKTK